MKMSNSEDPEQTALTSRNSHFCVYNVYPCTFVSDFNKQIFAGREYVETTCGCDVKK